MSTNLGHYGLNAMIVAGCALVALIVHLSVPYFVSWEDGDADTTKRSDLSDQAEFMDDAWVASAGPGITLAGTIIALAAGVALVAVGFIPMVTGPARWVGWLVAAVALIGSALAAISSFYWLGSWVSGMLNLNQPGGPSFIMAFSPLFVAILGGIGVWASLAIQRNVSPSDTRPVVSRDQRIALLALAFLAAVLLAPWALGTGGEGVAWASAHEVLTANGFSQGSLFGGTEIWDGLAYSLNVMVATGWVVFGVAVVTSLRGLLTTTPADAPATRYLPFGAFLSLFMMLWTAVVYVLAWSIYFKPTSDSENMQPGYFPIIVLAAAVPLTWMLVTQARAALAAPAPKAGRAGKPKPVRFD